MRVGKPKVHLSRGERFNTSPKQAKGASAAGPLQTPGSMVMKDEIPPPHSWWNAAWETPRHKNQETWGPLALNQSTRCQPVWNGVQSSFHFCLRESTRFSQGPCRSFGDEGRSSRTLNKAKPYQLPKRRRRVQRRVRSPLPWSLARRRTPSLASTALQSATRHSDVDAPCLSRAV